MSFCVCVNDMFFPESGVRVWLCTQPTDMRKSYDGLSALVINQLQEDPLSGQLFFFINRKGTQIKVLYYYSVVGQQFPLFIRHWKLELNYSPVLQQFPNVDF